MKLDENLVALRGHFVSSGFDLRIVGGAVRDYIYGTEPKDIDLCTDADPDQQVSIYKENGIRYFETGLQHGTVSVVLNGETYEITSLRVDKGHDGRHAQVEYTTDWILDQERRDLTINSMAMTFDGELVDPFNGESDLLSGKVRFVGDPELRIVEDYLRILRWLRFHARYAPDTVLDEATCVAVQKHGSGLANISRERVWMEVSKILTGNCPDKMMFEVYRLGIAKHLGLPEAATPECIWEIPKDAHPVTKLVAMLGRSAIAVTQAWKMSRHERALALFLVEHYCRCDYEYLICHDMRPISDVVELAYMNGDKKSAERILASVYPTMPVHGKDLMKLGFKTGPEVGKKLAALRDAWAASGFKATKEELLA